MSRRSPSFSASFSSPCDLFTSLAKPVSDEIIATGKVTHYTVGMQVQAIPPAVAEKAGLPAGLFVESVTPGGSAATAGIKEGDVITQINGETAVSAEQLTVAELRAKAGRTIDVTYSRDGQPTTVTLTPVLAT